ncbi:sensor histidine kinase [Bifidobacterium mongoliense]|uniref:sensor histidine kinase n=1 Tax=Bifidobacterium mongoliense TaxID=518643 RepID=UPI00264A4CD9|nr:histidine kinase [Bifidobacterium mongoliense]MDN5979512.1 histidine kinase [Bifidobacterium mongoliense]
MARHLYPGDIALLLCAMLVVLGLGRTVSSGYPGLLVNHDDRTASLWSCALLPPLISRRRHPEISAAVFAAIVMLQLVVGPSIVLPDFFALVMVFSVIVHGEPRHARTFIALAFVMGLIAAAVIAWSTEVGPLIERSHAFGTVARVDCATFYADGPTWGCSRSMFFSWLILLILITLCLLFTIVIAYWRRARMGIVRNLRERNASIESRQQEERRIAMLAERARIARDMHDMVAHTLSIIIVQSDGGRYAAAHDPALARRTMTTIRQESQHALASMGTLLDTLEQPDGDSDTRPTAGSTIHPAKEASYGQIERLVREARLSSPNNTVSRTIHGTPRPDLLTGGAGNALYRMVQEALTNIRKYAGDAVTVTILEQWSDTSIHISVADDGLGSQADADGHAPGYGLTGMRERIEAIKGTLITGPRTDHRGFHVEADIPLASTPGRVTPTTPIPMPISTLLDATNMAASHPGPKPEEKGMTVATTTTRGFLAHLHSLPVQTGPRNRRANIIERLSRWAQEHYLAVDATLAILATAVLAGLHLLAGPTGMYLQFGEVDVHPWAGVITTAATVLPLALRRRVPELSAACVGVASAVQLLLIGAISPENLFVLVSLYSVIMYGRRRAGFWVLPAVAADTALLVLSFVANGSGWSSPIAAILGMERRHHYYSNVYEIITGSVIIGVIILLMCLVSMGLALWIRSRGSNALVLQQRADALRAEEDKQRILAANMERNRIGASIQDEVNATLMSVRDQADEGLRMLEGYEERRAEPPSGEIVGAFSRIGLRGRHALSHMRRLLGMLRETGLSDDATAQTPAMALHPVSPQARDTHG